MTASAFHHGFKTWCEKYACEIRAELGTSKEKSIDLRGLARHLKIKVLLVNEIPNLSQECLEVLLRNDGKTPSCWSAVTLVVGDKKLIVLNSSHSVARQSSDLAHELAHQILKHSARQVLTSAEGLMLIESYDTLEESQADWLSACILLPREALIAIRKLKIDDVTAASTYGVSLKMLKYRLAITGVARQFV